MSRTPLEIDAANQGLDDASDGMHTAWSAVSQYRGEPGFDYQVCAFCDQAILNNEDDEHDASCAYRRASEALDALGEAVKALRGEKLPT